MREWRWTGYAYGTDLSGRPVSKTSGIEQPVEVVTDEVYGQQQQRYCWSCRHLFFDTGCPPDVTQGDGFDLSCEKDKFEPMRSGGSIDGFRERIETAALCNAFESHGRGS